jgi:hypothetical protein
MKLVWEPPLKRTYAFLRNQLVGCYCNVSAYVNPVPGPGPGPGPGPTVPTVSRSLVNSPCSIDTDASTGHSAMEQGPQESQYREIQDSTAPRIDRIPARLLKPHILVFQ